MADKADGQGKTEAKMQEMLQKKIFQEMKEIFDDFLKPSKLTEELKKENK